jgi:hypothetical protein
VRVAHAVIDEATPLAVVLAVVLLVVPLCGHR